MIKITIELVSAVHPSRSKILGVAKIYNDGTQSKSYLGNYQVELSKWAPKINEVWKKGRVENFNRTTRGSWDLLFLALKNIVGDRNK